MYNVFISYSRRDTKLAERVCKALSDAGLTYFIDRQGISAGVSFTEVLSKAIDESEVFLFLASSNSYKSKFTVSEVFYAFKHKPHGAIIPYILDDGKMPSELEFLLSTINWLDMKTDPIETSLVDAIFHAMGTTSRSEARKDKTEGTRKWLLPVIIATILVVGVSAAILFDRRHASRVFPSSDLAAYNGFVDLSDSLVREAARLKALPNTIETTDTQIYCLQRAVSAVASADSIKKLYAGGEFEASFKADLRPRTLIINSRLDSMHRAWAGYARDSYELYQITGLKTEAQNALDCIGHALKIRQDGDLERIRTELNRK